MADEQIIISVNLDEGQTAQRLDAISKQMADLKIKQRELNDQYKAGAVNEEFYLKKSKELSVQLSTLNRQQTNLTAALQAAEKTNDDYSDSIDGMRAKLNDMQRAYATLTKAQRESAEGQEFLRAIGEQDAAVKGLEQSIGDARRNVGDYEGAIKRAFPAIGNLSDGIDKATGIFQALGKGGVSALKGIVSGLGQATKASLKFIATPIGAVIAAIVAAVALMTAGFRKLQEAFKKNDEAGTNMAKLFASFEPILDGISRLFDKLAAGIGKVAARLADWIGSNNEAAKAAQNLVVAVDNLEQAERDYTVNSAARNKEISELRAKATQTEKYSAEERIALLTQAMELEKKNLEEQKTIAAERLRILEETAKKESDTSDETTNKIAQAKAALYQAEEQYYSGTRRLLSQLNTAEKEVAEERAARRQAALEEAFRVYDEETKRAKLLQESLEQLANVEEERAKIKKQQEEELEKLRKEAESYIEPEEEEENIPSVDEIVRARFGLDEEAIAYYNELLESGMDAQQRFAAMSEWSAKRAAKSFADAAGSMAGAFNNMANMLNKYGAENKKAQAASKAFALAGILASQAQAIAEGALAISAGIAQSQSVPFPANLAAIASTTATILGLITSTASSFMQAKQLLSSADAGAYEQGGVIGGTSYSGDRLTARVNSGEMILTREQQANLFQMANAQTSMGFDYAALAAAMAAQPAPVMDYTEFKQFEQKVSNYQELTKI